MVDPLLYATSSPQASYTRVLPCSSPVICPAASNAGVVAPLMAVISFCLLAVRVWVVPSVVTESQLPAAS